MSKTIAHTIKVQGLPGTQKTKTLNIIRDALKAQNYTTTLAHDAEYTLYVTFNVTTSLMNKPKLNSLQLTALRDYHCRRFAMSGAFAILKATHLGGSLTRESIEQLEYNLIALNKDEYQKQKKRYE